MSASEPVRSDQSLTDHLIETGKLKPEDLRHLERFADVRPQSLGLLLTRVGLVSDRDLAEAHSTLLDLPLLSDRDIPLVPAERCAFKESFLRDAKILPLVCEDDGWIIATAAPDNAFALNALTLAIGKPASICIGTLTQIDGALDRWFGQPQEDVYDTADAADEDTYEDVDAIDRLRDLASEAPVVRLVSSIIQNAVEMRASDIHVEPFNGALRVRYRVDGVLQVVETPSARSGAAVVSRIKLMAKMNIAERRLPQDGRIQIRMQGATIDLRASTVPTVDGESVVLRILEQDTVSLTLDALGFDTNYCNAIREAIRMPHGIVLVTGPTGSGKTTTLYAMLQKLNDPERKIVTIEDPVEYQLEGINQIQVKPKIGLDFPHALRSVVRQDPDTIMIGEMRDLETARIAVQSALTGHLVFSTLHTNDAGSSVTRLLDMGVADYLVTSSVNVVIAQRLVRRLCPRCRIAQEPPNELTERLSLDRLTQERPIKIFLPGGCEDCDNTGYRGRIVIAELLTLSDQLRRAVLSRADGKSLEGLAVGEGMRTMKVDGLGKALLGLTSIDEVTRVTFLS